MSDRKGCLYIVPTPIGNLKDITLRAIEVLKEVDFVATEDTRTAGKLFKLLGLTPKKFVSYYDNVENEKSDFLINKLTQGCNVALISEAGTPLISDPGYKLVSKCINSGIKIVPLPGATSLIPALVASGLPVDKFKFFGFPPKKKGMKKFIESFVNETSTSICLISCHNIVKFINEISKVLEPTRRICLAREISKLNEEFIRGTIEEIVSFVNSSNVVLKGEFVLVLEGKGEK